MWKSEPICEESRPLKVKHRNMRQTFLLNTKDGQQETINMIRKHLHYSSYFISFMHSQGIKLVILAMLVPCSTVWTKGTYCTQQHFRVFEHFSIHIFAFSRCFNEKRPRIIEEHKLHNTNYGKRRPNQIGTHWLV